MNEVWDEARIEKYITDEIEESLNLDYKAAGALDKKKKDEITKDVSAMANSDGGIIIYGLSEDPARRHYPGAVDPIDRRQFSKEWLEQVIGNIRPKIDGLIIYPVPIQSDPNHVVFVVDIPKSHTAHQATDKKYYKRFNFLSEPMEDYEIRDVMGRGQFPRIGLEFQIVITEHQVQKDSYTSPFSHTTESTPEKTTIAQYALKVWAVNSGRIYAQYVNAFIELPDVLLPVVPPEYKRFQRPKYQKDGTFYLRRYVENTIRDQIGATGFVNNEGPVRYVPILPGRDFRLYDVNLRQDFESQTLDNLHIEWEVFADNAPPSKGKIAVSGIKFVDKRDNSE